MSIPLLSVCVNTYNHVNYIREAIDGVLNQKVTFSWELIIADDFSTDGTREILLEYKRKHKDFIKLILQKSNVGAAHNGFDLLNASASKYLAYCEGDDYWINPYKLQKQVDFLEKNEDYGLVWTDVNFYYQTSGLFKNMVFKNKILPIYNSFNEVLVNCAYIAPCTWLFRQEYVPKEKNEYCDGTFAMALDILAKTKIKYLDEVTAVYRYLNESASHHTNSMKHYKRIKAVHGMQKEYIKKYNLAREIEEKVELKYYEYAFPYVVMFDDIKAVEKGKVILKKSFPKSTKTRVSLFLSNFCFGKYILKIIYTLKNKYLSNCQ